MTVRNMLLGGVLAAGLMMSPANAQDDYTVRLVAGSPGYDHIQPFMAELHGIWEKYGLNVDFIGGNYQRSNQMMSIGDFDVGYNQYATAIRYNSAGIPNVIVAASSANCAMIVAAPDVNSWEDTKDKRFGIVTKFDVQYLTLIKHILPRFGLSESDVQLAAVPVPETAAALVTGDVAAAFPFEPYGSNAVARGAKVLLAPQDLVDKDEIGSDMLRNGLIMNRGFMEEHPELAKRIVWAHLDAVHVMRTDKSQGIEVLKHYNPNIEEALLEDSYSACGWDYDAPPPIWIETLIGWMGEEKLLQGDVAYDTVVDLSMAESYPGYPGWEHLEQEAQ
jgi:ABC-type nitrate/sulfonate/bicarbonate transport system substrate-binding protein